MLSESQFKRIFPACPAHKARIYLPCLNSAMREFEIEGRLRIAAFCAQVGHESLDFKYMQEIASGAAYEGRRDLGNTEPGDGVRFKGRGPIQTTGRANYRRAGIALGLPLLDRPALLCDPQHAFRASAFFWQSNKLNKKADALSGKGDSTDLKRFDKITRIINGGYNHRVERQRRYLVALEVLTGEALLAPPQKTDEQQQAISLPNSSSEANSAQTTPISAPAPESSLLDEIPVNETTKELGKTVAAKAGARLLTPTRLLVAALSAGSMWAWVGLVLFVTLAGWMAYRHRAALKTHALKLLRKFKG